MKSNASPSAKKNTIAFQNFLRNAAAITLFAAPYVASMTPTKATATDWSFDFGTSTTAFTNYTGFTGATNTSSLPLAAANGGSTYIRGNSTGSSISYANPGSVYVGTGGELTLNNTGATATVTAFNISGWTATKYFDISFQALTSEVGSAYGQFTAGSGSDYTSINALTGAQTAAGIKFLASSVQAYNAGTWTTVTAAGLAAGTAGVFRVIGNTSTTSISYTLGSTGYTVGAGKVDYFFMTTSASSYTLLADDFATNSGMSTTAVNGLAFKEMGGASNTTSTFTVDNIAYSNSTPAVSAGSFYNGGTGTWSSTSANFSTSAAVGLTLVQDNGSTTLTFGGTAGTVTVSGGVTAAGGATFTTTGYTITGSSINLTGTSAAANTIIIDGASSSASVASALTGTNGLTKAGTGSLTLSGANTYSGTTAISAGTLRAVGTSAMGTSSVTLSGGTLELANDTNSTYTNNVTVSANSTIKSDLSSGTGAGITNTLGTLTIGAQTLTIDKGSNVTSGTAGVTFGATTLSGASTFTVNSGSQLNLAAITLVNATALTIGGAGDTTVSGVISGGSSSSSLVKTGTGTLTLSGNSSYSGFTNITAGTVKLGNTGAANASVFGSGSSTNARVSITNGGTLDLNGFVSASQGKTFLIAGTGAASAGGAIINSSTTAAQNYGAIILTADATIAANSGAITLSASDSAKTLDLNGYNLTLAGSTGGTVSHAIFGGSKIIKSGSGTWTLTPSNNTTAFAAYGVGSGANAPSSVAGPITAASNVYWTGGLDINVGTIRLGTNSALAGGGNVTVASGATLDLNGRTIDSTNALSIIGSAALVNNNATASSFAGLVTLTGNATINAATGNITLGNIGTISGDTFTLTVDGAKDTSITSIIGTGAGGITKNGAGRLTLAGANTLSGAININTGTIRITNASGLGNTSRVTIASGATLDVNGVSQTNSNAVTVSGAGDTLGGRTGAITNTSSSTSTLKGLVTLAGDTTLSASSGTLNLTNTGSITGSGFTLTAFTNSSNNIQIDSTIDTGLGGIIKTGTGRLTLNAGNSYTGTTQINAGTVRVTHARGLGESGDVNVASGATLDLYGQTITKTNTVTISGTGAASAGGALTNSKAADATSFNGLVKLGADATINATSNNITLNNTGTTTGDGFTLTVGGAYNTTINSIIGTGTGGLIKNGAGTLTLNGVNTYTGTTTINAGTIVTKSANIAGAIVNDATLEFNNTSAANYSGTITGSGIFTKSGAGALTLNSAVAHTGATNITGGTLTLGSNNGKLTGTSAITVSKDATLKSTNTTDSVLQASAIVLNSGAIIDLTAGNLTATSLTVGALNPSEVTKINFGINKGLSLTDLTLTGNLAFDLLGTPSTTGTYDVLTWSGNKTGSGTVNLLTQDTSDWAYSLITTNPGKYQIKVDVAFVDGGPQSSGTVAVPEGKTVGAVSGSVVVSAPNTTTVGAISGGTVNLSGANNTVGAISGGTVNLNAAGSTVASLATGGTLNVKANSTVTSLTGGNLSVDSGVNVTVNSTTAATSTAVLTGAGSLVKTGNAKLTLEGNSSSFTGAINVAAGEVEAKSVAALGSGTGTSAALSLGTASNSTVAKLTYSGAQDTIAKDITALSTSRSGNVVENSGSGALTLSGSLTKNGTVLTLAGGTNGINVTGSIIGSAANSDLIVSSGTVKVSSSNSYNGPTFIENGATLIADNASATGSGIVNVASGATLQVGTSTNHALTLSTGGFALTNGAIIRVYVNSIDITGLTANSGAGINTAYTHYDMTADAGIDYSTLLTSGALDVTGVTAGGITIQVYSTGASTSGFEQTPFYDFKFLQAGSVTGLGSGLQIADLFTINTANLKYADGTTVTGAKYAGNSIPGLLKVYMLNNGGNTVLMMSIPEPSTYGLGLGALALAAVAIRRRKQKKSVA
jgi:autotransporter-associated beta strand protein